MGKIIRPTTDVYMMALAMLAAKRATCSRRSVGCILTNKHNHIIATGYNGTPRGLSHCSSEFCPGKDAASGTNLDGCMATHAEQNALLQCRNTEEIYTAYVTAAPCVTCTKLLLNTSCNSILYLESYPHDIAADLWHKAGRSLVRLNQNDVISIRDLFQTLYVDMAPLVGEKKDGNE